MIFSFDPGGCTGFVIYDHETQTVLEYGEIEFEDTPLELNRILSKVTSTDTVVCERYVITPRTVKFTRQYEAFYVIGAILFFLGVNGLGNTFKFQMAAAAKTGFPSEKLKELGLFKQVVGGHARDALRHAAMASNNL